ncbi:hypothetical protein N9N67_00045 [Bacteriovoracaceae bacterium]|nr:hypothetical protein [Bacteriovoracaceae bacterium]
MKILFASLLIMSSFSIFANERSGIVCKEANSITKAKLLLNSELDAFANTIYIDREPTVPETENNPTIKTGFYKVEKINFVSQPVITSYEVKKKVGRKTKMVNRFSICVTVSNFQK